MSFQPAEGPNRALIGAFSEIVQLHRLIIYITALGCVLPLLSAGMAATLTLPLVLVLVLLPRTYNRNVLLIVADDAGLEVSS